MTATAIIREEYELTDDWQLSKKSVDDDGRQGKLNKYYHSYNNFMPYQYAIYTTAHARDALYTMIEATGRPEINPDDLTSVYENFLYCDTDSVFYIESDYNKIAMEKYAADCRERARKAGAFVDNKYLGEPTDEAPIRAFRGLHSKCYAMEEYNKKKGKYELVVVIAGIPKKSTKWIKGKPVEKTNAEELGTIDDLNDGFTFKHCGGTRCVYNERPVEVIQVNGHKIELASSAVIENIEKEISDTMYTKGKDYTPLKIVQESI